MGLFYYLLPETSLEMLWSQIIYGHRTASISPKINFLDIVRCPVKFRYYLKFHSAHTAFGRVNEGKMTLAGHRTVPGWRPVTICTHRTGTGRFLFKIYIVWFQRCIIRCLTSAGNFKKSLNKSADALPGIGQCFMSLTATGEKRRVFAVEHIAFT